ncbi:MAG: UDP-3-O-(3-hydroxymyristoyl)glucosamine N-acyltransferase [Planctomycetota bacterium]
MEFRLDELAELVGGKLYGDASKRCDGTNPPGLSTESQLSMVVDGDVVSFDQKHRAIAVLTPEYCESSTTAQIVVADPHAAFAVVVAKYRPPVAPSLPGVGADSSVEIANSAKVHPSATICSHVTIGERSLVMPGVVIMEGSTIGEDCIIYPGVTVYPLTQIDDRVVVHAGSVIGANGFGYRQNNGRHLPLAQLGYVHIHHDVEIGACVTIDRGSYGATTIGEGTKIDNQVMIAHNCQIGRHNLICSQVGIAGSCTTGDYVILAGQVGLKDHIHLADHTIVGAKAGVMDDCEGNQVYLGAPAMPQREQMQIFALQRKLPDMRRELKMLRKQMVELTQRLESEESRSNVHDSERAA